MLVSRSVGVSESSSNGQQLTNGEHHHKLWMEREEGNSQWSKACMHPVGQHSWNCSVEPSKSMFPSALMSSSFRISSSSPFFSFSPSSVLTASFISSWLIIPSPSRSNCTCRREKSGWTSTHGSMAENCCVGYRPAQRLIGAPSAPTCELSLPSFWVPSVQQSPQSPSNHPLWWEKGTHWNEPQCKKKKLNKTNKSNCLTSHLDLLHNLQQLHFCGHVAHSPHAFCNVFIVQVSILIVVKLLEGLLQLCTESYQELLSVSSFFLNPHCRKPLICTKCLNTNTVFLDKTAKCDWTRAAWEYGVLI